MESRDSATGGEPAAPAVAADARGSNQSGMRAHNERLVLTLLRRHGALAKSDIARLTGLSAQTVSVIMRGLEQDGFLLRNEPVRGRIGQPSVPMALHPDGAFFAGLKIGRRSADLILVDFLGVPRARERRTYHHPTPAAVLAFVAEALPRLTAALTPAQRLRLGGLGVAMPFQLWAWVDYIGAPQAEMDAWRNFDIAAELGRIAAMPVMVQNDATAACGAELVLGTTEKPKDFLYFYFGYFIGGGLVLNNRLFPGRSGNAAGVGTMPVPQPGGRTGRLMAVASMWPLARAMEEAGVASDPLWERPEGWDVPDAVLAEWLASASTGLATAILSSAALLELDAVVIDGWMPAAVRAAIVAQTRAALHGLDLAGITPPQILEGSVGPEARALGAAMVPLAARYLLDPEAVLVGG